MDNELFSAAMILTDKVISGVSGENLNKPTPCSEWDVEKLVNHMLNELAWIAPLIEGKTIAEVGDSLDGDLIKGKAAVSWLDYCTAASEAMAKADPKAIAHLSYADKSNQAYVDEVSADLIVHGWDLAQALGMDYVIDDKTAAAVLKATEDVMPLGRRGGLIGEEVKVPEGASAMDKMLAIYGRSANWRR